jgi:hypothetical protein
MADSKQVSHLMENTAEEVSFTSYLFTYKVTTVQTISYENREKKSKISLRFSDIMNPERWILPGIISKEA